MSKVTRHFVNVDGRQQHLRHAGHGAPVVLLHATPRSSESQLGLIEALRPHCAVYALDTPGYGSSEPLPTGRPSIADYAAAISATLDALRIDRCALYGEGTGACIALELASGRPERFGGVVIRDARAVPAGTADEVVPQLAPPLDVVMDGTHLLRHWAIVRDEHLFAPWWDRRPENRLHRDLPSPEQLHAIFIERLRAGSAYAAGHWAAAGYDPEARSGELGALVRDAGGLTAAETAQHLIDLAGDAPPAPPLPRTEARPGRQSKRYVDTPYGQTLVRFREDAPGRPVVLLHASPISGFTLEGLVEGFAPHRPVYALDTIANGESDKPDIGRHPQFERPSLKEFGEWLIAVLDGLGFAEADVYGSHTGAMIALEAAIQAPERFANLVLDGVTMHDEQESEEIFGGYFLDIRPTYQGHHILTCWTQMQDVTLWHPFFLHDVAHLSEFPIIEASHVHEHTVEMLKRGEWHERCYRPVYEYPTAERLPLLQPRTLIATPPDDYLERFSTLAASLAPNAETGTAPRSVTTTERYYAPFVPDAGVAEYYLGFFDAAPPDLPTAA